MTIEYDLQHAEWIEANVPGEKRSIDDKVVMHLAAEVKRLRIQLGGMFGGVSRERIFEMGKELGREGVKREPHLSAETVDALLNALNEQVCRLNADNDRLRRERHELLGVKTTEGLGAAEWMARTADAEGRMKRAEAKLERAKALLAKWPADLAMFKAQAHPTWQTDPTALIERATAAFCEELEDALRSVE